MREGTGREVEVDGHRGRGRDGEWEKNGVGGQERQRGRKAGEGNGGVRQGSMTWEMRRRGKSKGGEEGTEVGRGRKGRREGERRRPGRTGERRREDKGRRRRSPRPYI